MNSAEEHKISPVSVALITVFMVAVTFLVIMMDPTDDGITMLTVAAYCALAAIATAVTVFAVASFVAFTDRAWPSGRKAGWGSLILPILWVAAILVVAEMVG